MGLDMKRMAAAAVEAAFEDEAPQERPRSRHPVRAVAAGVVLAGAARIALARTSALRELRGGLKVANFVREAPDRIREGIGDRLDGLRDRLGGLEDEDAEAAEGDEPETSEEPEASEESEASEEREASEEPEEAVEEEPAPEEEAEAPAEEAEGSAEEEPEGSEEEAEESSDDEEEPESDDLVGVLSTPREPPPALSRLANRR